jgi:GrpB-like predicted nucleotidyltransferase (UPF0157 family)/cytidylate kinase
MAMDTATEETDPLAASHGSVIYLLTGPMAAGKTTIARLLAARFARGVYLEGDFFRRSIVRGREEMTPELSPAALEQLRLRYRLAASAADAYYEAGFNVALEDVVAGPLLGEYRVMIRSRPCHVIVLLPSVEAVAARERGRQQKGYTHWTVEQLYEGFVTTTPRIGVWLDTTNLTAHETVDAVLASTSSGRSPVAVTEHDDAWPMLFDEIAAPVRHALADLGAEIEHVGSTSVPGLAAKPVIDMDVVVHSPENVSTAIERLRTLGYVYQGNKGIIGREAFLWPPGAPRHHLYVVIAGSQPYVNHVTFRDYLRQHSEVAVQYAALKRRLAEEYGHDQQSYTDAKSEFIAGVLEAARRGE